MPVHTRFHIRRKIFALVLCLIFSSMLWLLNNLNGVQTITVQIPVKFTGLPYDMVTTNSLPSSMEATIEATGFTLLFRNLRSPKTVVEIPLRLENGMLAPGRNYLFNVNYYMQDITDALGRNLKIKRLFPDTFSIRFEKKFIKKVPIYLSSDIQFEKEFDISGLAKLSPDSVIISGTKARVNEVDSVPTQRLVLKGVNKTYQGKLALDYMNGISFNEDKVQVELPVGQFTEKLINLKVIPKNVPLGFELNIIPDNIQMKVLVPIRDFNDIDISQFEVIAEFPEDPKRLNKILLKVSHTPDFVKVKSIKPAAVEFKIKQTN